MTKVFRVISILVKIWKKKQKQNKTKQNKKTNNKQKTNKQTFSRKNFSMNFVYCRRA